MNSQLNTVEIPSLIQERVVKKIMFAERGITIETPLNFDPNKFIPVDNISAFRFGVRDLHLFKMTFCTQYFIETRDYHNKIFRVKLNSYYGIKRKVYFKVWADLLEHFWNFYMANQLSFYTELFQMQQLFELSGVTFHADGISWDGCTKLKWNEIELSNYQTHFVIKHVDKPGPTKTCVFAVHWNAAILQYLLKDIVKQPTRIRKPSL